MSSERLSFLLAPASALLIALGGSPALAEAIPFDDPRWTFEAEVAEIVDVDGRTALRLHGGRAWLPDLEILDGVVSFDLLFGPERGFSGAMVRAVDAGNFENFYFRPHQSGKPDASQYTPEIAGVSGWQLYHGPEFSPPFTYRFGEWMHVEIAFAGTRATVSLDGETHLVPSLRREPVAAAVGLRSGFAPAHFANFRVREGVPEDFPGVEPPETQRELPEGLVREWRISEAFPVGQRPSVRLDDAFREGLAWTSRTVEPEGFVNLARAEGVGPERRAVLAELVLEASEPGHRLVSFGTSDLVRVFVDGREAYRGTNLYRSRDFRYLGTIGLFDAVVVPVGAGSTVVTFVVAENFGGWGIMASVEPVEVAGGAASAAGVEGEPSRQSSLELRIDPWTDFYFLVRAQAGGVTPREPDLDPIVEAWLPVQEHIGTFGGFWRFDLPGLLTDGPEAFAEWFADAPTSVPSRAGGQIPIRAPGLAMAGAMRGAWPRFRDERWPERSAELHEAVARLEERFLPRHREALQHMLDALGIEDPGISVPMWLTLDTHAPGASTYRAKEGPVAVLSTRDLLGEGRLSDLEETLLHEICHALDLASEGDDDAFTVLRRLLEERGVGRSDPRWHDVPHLVMFVQAENTMRRLFDPEHVAYGDTRRGDIAPLYERSGEAAEIVRREWGAFLDGELERSRALERIADAVTSESGP